MNVLGIFARAPEAGSSKTRLALGIGPTEAAALSDAFLRDLADRYAAAADRRFLCHTPSRPDTIEFFQGLSRGRYELWAQPSGTLDERLCAYFQFAAAIKASCAVVIGSDAPTLPAEFLGRAFELLETKDVVLGPATDGGYYLIGVRLDSLSSDDRIGTATNWLQGIEWSTPIVLAQTCERIRALGWTVGVLAPWYDVHTADSLEMLRGHLAMLRLAGAPSDNPHTERQLRA
jgi:rSAM/selenodomain-associated transferase 1